MKRLLLIGALLFALGLGALGLTQPHSLHPGSAVPTIQHIPPNPGTPGTLPPLPPNPGTPGVLP